MSDSQILSPVLRRVQVSEKGLFLAYYCPGCRHAHRLPIESATYPTWTWNGDAEKPTFNPSIKSWVREDRAICHHWVRNGQIEFLDDSGGHKLRGLHDMVPFPEGYGT